MINDQFEDLKQFIDSRISQSELTVNGQLKDLKSELKKDISDLRQEMLNGFAGVGEAIDDIHKQLDETKDEFDKRLTKLEQQAA